MTMTCMCCDGETGQEKLAVNTTTGEAYYFFCSEIGIAILDRWDDYGTFASHALKLCSHCYGELRGSSGSSQHCPHVA